MKISNSKRFILVILVLFLLIFSFFTFKKHDDPWHVVSIDYSDNRSLQNDYTNGDLLTESIERKVAIDDFPLHFKIPSSWKSEIDPNQDHNRFKGTITNPKTNFSIVFDYIYTSKQVDCSLRENNPSGGCGIFNFGFVYNPRKYVVVNLNSKIKIVRPSNDVIIQSIEWDKIEQ